MDANFKNWFDRVKLDLLFIIKEIMCYNPMD